MKRPKGKKRAKEEKRNSEDQKSSDMEASVAKIQVKMAQNVAAKKVAAD